MKITKRQLTQIIKEEKAKILQEQPQQLDFDYILDLVGEALAEGGAIATARDRGAVIDYMDFLVKRFGGRR